MTDPERLLQVEGGGLSTALLRAGRDDGPSEKLLGTPCWRWESARGPGRRCRRPRRRVQRRGREGGQQHRPDDPRDQVAGHRRGRRRGDGGRHHRSRSEPEPCAKPPATVAAPARIVEAPAPTGWPPEWRRRRRRRSRPSALPPRRSTVAPALEAPLPSIADETRAIDQARRELREGNAGQALATLDQYDRLPGPHRLQQEALLLRMDALVRSGNAPAARLVAKSCSTTAPMAPTRRARVRCSVPPKIDQTPHLRG